MLLLRNGLLQKSAFLRHNRCIELGKRYIKALALSNSRLGQVWYLIGSCRNFLIFLIFLGKQYIDAGSKPTYEEK